MSQALPNACLPKRALKNRQGPGDKAKDALNYSPTFYGSVSYATALEGEVR